MSKNRLQVEDSAGRRIADRGTCAPLCSRVGLKLGLHWSRDQGGTMVAPAQAAQVANLRLDHDGQQAHAAVEALHDAALDLEAHIQVQRRPVRCAL